MNLVLLGLPGSGKGTQAELLSERLGLFYLATGDLARDWASKDARIKKIVDSGNLIPEREMTEYVMQYLERNVPEGKGIIFEGFPRFISQFEEYEKWLKKKGEGIDKVISLDISEESAVKRISARRICEKCGRVYNLITNPPPKPNECECGGKLIIRHDDKPEVVKVRYRYFLENTKKLMDYLDKKNKLIHIDADRPIEVIFRDILEKLEINDE